ncbi:MAG: AAA family ATPase [Peptococcaceae bacterium]|nr:AAA family ATPase [Peptococcaceae bacterium]
MTNAITRVEIRDFLVFKGDFAADFCPGVNVLIGRNGSGKTTLMKFMYFCCDLAGSRPVGKYFDANASIDLPNTGGIFMGGGRNADGLYKLPAVYIPTDEILSRSKGFLALNNEREMPFDQTLIDILSKAELPVTRKITPNAAKTLDKIKAEIDGEVIYENDTFYVVKSDLSKLPFSFEASGFRKLGLLWKLLRNGLLESGSVLFWDEPESSVNPELIPILVDILLELQRGGVQIFAATHSYDVARWFELNKKSEDTLRYLNLRKDGDQIVADVANDYISLDGNSIEEAGDKLYSRVVRVMAEKAGVKPK